MSVLSKKARNALAAVLMGAALFGAGEAFPQTRLDGAGATFPAPIYERWFKDLAADGGPQVNYQATGSGTGVKLFTNNDVDFGASDSSMDDAKVARVRRGVVQIPMTGGAIAVAYNKPGCDLRLSQSQVVGIFMGSITNWSTLSCAPGIITVAHRSDGSGTTAGFTKSLSAFSSAWEEKVGDGKTVEWPVGVGGKGNSGVAGLIQNKVGTIGYVNYGYVQRSGLQVAALQNKDGNYVKPSAATAAEGLSKIVLDDQLRGTDANPAGANSFPIVSLTWVLAYQTGNGRNLDALKEAFNYMLSDEAQAISDSLGYVPLPDSVVAKSKAAVASLRP
ncbi:phosphate ABC transporter substrate-binding protein PstS [Candidatus Synechococcus spongiarum]|uniref:Phosphate-binding protein n=1 Tax=Candidatus Synechococcus spongiarum TaxID=431041 RepID=A0A164YUU2_9SYNE|nr:phosphate ABC transporter substrate-binding protein PstS [Candidatus Synechococcus spongiarum]SAY38258.1 Phosphate ABC transporter, periplasmic phosphate-binding protein PstS (TC 3.A.1.7.1) [Candidatus Synechococcus spongiarum]